MTNLPTRQPADSPAGRTWPGIWSAPAGSTRRWRCCGTWG